MQFEFQGTNPNKNNGFALEMGICDHEFSKSHMP